MKRLLVLLLILGMALPMSGQTARTHITTGAALPASCTLGDFWMMTGASPGPYWCSAANTWTGPLSTGTGTVTASGTLTANRLIIGSGTTVVAALGSLGTTTTLLHGDAAGAPTFAAVANADLAGSIAASKLIGTDIATVGTITTGTWTGTAIAFANGGTGLTSASDDQVMVSSGSAWVAKSVANCTDTGGNHLNYTAATNAFSCGTSGGGGGAALSAITAAAGANTIANGNNHSQIWNWALATNAIDAFAFGETTAATNGVGDSQALVSITSLATSTAVPLYIHCFGSVTPDCFRVDDVAGDAAPFVINSGGQVWINSASASGGAYLTVTGDSMIHTLRLTDGTRIVGYDIDGNGVQFGTITNHDLSFIVNNGSPMLRLATGMVRLPGSVLVSSGTVPGISGCSAGTQTGGASAGTFTSGTTGACTVTLTLGVTAPTGYSCASANVTTPANLYQQSGGSTTTAIFTGTTISGDVIRFHCVAY